MYNKKKKHFSWLSAKFYLVWTNLGFAIGSQLYRINGSNKPLRARARQPTADNTSIVRKVFDLIFFAETNLMDFNEERLHKATLNLHAHA